MWMSELQSMFEIMGTDNTVYQTHILPTAGSEYEEVYKEAKFLFACLKYKTKRKIYIRSAYFNQQKIFFDYFWEHLFQKPKGQRIWRLKLFPCALELIKHTRCKPFTMKGANFGERLYRFYGETRQHQLFLVQVKEHLPSETKQFLSVFPVRRVEQN